MKKTIKPWENTAVIKCNLDLFEKLGEGEKIKKYDQSGHFGKSKAGYFQGWGRSKSDSITNLKSDIIKIFEEAKKRALNYDAALNGIRRLKAIYQTKQEKNNAVDEIITAVENLDKNFANHAYNTLQIVRNQIKWSNNKIYRVTTNMSSKAAKFPMEKVGDLDCVERISFINNRFLEAYKMNNVKFSLNNSAMLEIIKNKKKSDTILTKEELAIWEEHERRFTEKDELYIRKKALNELADLGVGTCNEMSRLAFNHLKSLNVPVVKVSLGDGERFKIGKNKKNAPAKFSGDHLFLLVGQCFQEFDENGKFIGDGDPPYLDYGYSFNEGVYVCDPWGNIVCPVRQYSGQWELKMQKWSSVKKNIGYTDKYFHKKLQLIDPYENINYRKCISLCEWKLNMQHIPS